MPDSENVPSRPTDGPDPEPVRDAVEVMRERAMATRREREQSIAELRESMTDDQASDEFGIDLGEMER